ncbi:MAG: DUF5050 domain-containing protein [bacterium]|nr:DUF5050 domain-containing protein [bacterium]
MGKKIKFSVSIRIFFVLTAGIILLSACGKSEDNDMDAVPIRAEADTIESDFGYPRVAESENGYYVWERINQDRFYPRLLFIDKESGRAVPLCNKPDCVHEGEECNAYFADSTSEKGGVYKGYLQYDKGDLYAIGLSEDAYISLFRIKADGSAEWEISAKLYRTDYAVTGHFNPPELLIDDGYVYFVDWYQKVQKLERMPIGGGEPEVLFEGDGSASAVNIYRIKSSDGSLFFQVMSYSDDLPGNAAGELYRCDPASGQCSLVKEGLSGPYSVNDGCVYYGNTEGLCRYSIREESTEILAGESVDVPDITLTEAYIIFCDQMADSALIIYDYDGREITTVSNTLGLYWYFGGNSDMLFGEYADDRGSNLCFLNLNRPVEELQWEELKVD